jgi:hypothetical protein
LGSPALEDKGYTGVCQEEDEGDREYQGCRDVGIEDQKERGKEIEVGGQRSEGIGKRAEGEKEVEKIRRLED